MIIIGDIRFPVNHRFNRAVISMLDGMQIKAVTGPYSTGVGEVFDPTGVGEVFDPSGDLGIILNGEG